VPLLARRAAVPQARSAPAPPALAQPPALRPLTHPALCARSLRGAADRRGRWRGERLLRCRCERCAGGGVGDEPLVSDLLGVAVGGGECKAASAERPS